MNGLSDAFETDLQDEARRLAEELEAEREAEAAIAHAFAREYFRRLGVATVFPLGKVVITSGLLSVVQDVPDGVDIIGLLARHAAGDDGDLCSEDKRSNAWAIAHGERVFSSYNVPQVPGGKVWVITEADRSSTCVLLPDEY